jgi:transcription antitermination factor NusG
METHDLRNSDYIRKLATDAQARETVRRTSMQSRPAGQERWYLAREARRFNEEVAAPIFAEYCVETYMPKFRKLVPVPLSKITLKQRRNGFRPREEKLFQLFPGFQLIRLDFRRDDWRELFDRTRICGMLGVEKGGRLLPQPVGDYVLEQFRRREELGALPGSLNMRSLGYSIGEAIRINEGAFSGYKGVVDDLPDIPIDAVDDDVKVRLLIMVFGRATPVEISLSQIESSEGR